MSAPAAKSPPGTATGPRSNEMIVTCRREFAADECGGPRARLLKRLRELQDNAAVLDMAKRDA